MSNNKGGRTRGVTQDVINYRKSLKLLETIHKQINDDVLTAYDVLTDMLRDDTTKDSVRKAIAKDIITLFMEFSGDSNDVLGEPKNRHQERQAALGEKAESLVNKKVVEFK